MSGMPTGLATIPTRQHVPFHLAQCVYCLTTVEFVDPEAIAGEQARGPPYRKLECVQCGMRFLIERDSNNQVHKSTPFKIQLPNETLATIFSFATANVHSPRNNNPLAPSTLVSKHWNSTATPFLYRHIEIEDWDSRVEKTLLATLERHPILLTHIRSIKASYPDLVNWEDNFFHKDFTKIYDQILEVQHGLLDPDERERQQADLLATGMLDPTAADQAQEQCEVLTQNVIDSKGAGGWFEPGEGTSTSFLVSGRRRAGALALLNLVARCPRLSRLELMYFDFGRISLRYPLSDVIPSSLPTIRALSLTRIGRSDPTHELVSRMANLEELATEVFPTLEPHQEWSLPKLRTLDLGCLNERNITGALALLRGSGLDALKSLSFKYADDSNIMRIIRSRPDLEVLSLSPSHHGTSLPLRELLSFLKSLSSLQTLKITTTFTPELAASLPTSIVILAVCTPVGFAAAEARNLEGALEALIVSKRSSAPLIQRVYVVLQRRPSIQEMDSLLRVMAKVVEAGIRLELLTPEGPWPQQGAQV